VRFWGRGARNGLVAGIMAWVLVGSGVLVGVAPGAAAQGGQSPLVRSPNLAAPDVPSGSTPEGSLPGGQSLQLLVSLAPSNQAGLQQLLMDEQDPSSPEYHDWLAPGQFDPQFGPSPSSVSAVETWLRGKGISDLTFSGLAVSATASASTVTAGLGTPFARYRSADGHTGYSATEAPLVPEDLSGGTIQAIVGLDTTSTMQPQIAGEPTGEPVPTGGAGTTPSLMVASPQVAGPVAAQPEVGSPAACPAAQEAATTPNGDFYTLDELGDAYGIGSLLSAGQNGRGETVGLYELGQAVTGDVSSYESCLGLTNPLVIDPVDGGASPGFDGTAEADSDIEQVAAQAPGAAIISYEGPNSPQGDYDVWDTIVANDTAQVISTSWGQCEPQAEADGTIGAYTALFGKQLARDKPFWSPLVIVGRRVATHTTPQRQTRSTIRRPIPGSQRWAAHRSSGRETRQLGTGVSMTKARRVW
jgi:subtilase family serine protease